jgi:two-component system, NarL family, nitrate/nitrite response regulator NarL
MIKILLADDHQMVIDGIKALLMHEPEIKIEGEALHGQAALDFLACNEVDLLIMDINMPGLDGIEIARVVRKQYPTVRILVLTMYNKPAFIRGLIEVGVSGYILKNTGKEELLTAIRRVMSGEDYFDAEVTRTMLSTFKVADENAAVKLTRREEEVLRLIAKAHTTAEIAEKLFLSTYTIDTHRKNLLGKLHLKNTAGLVNYAIKNGYVDDKF